MTLTPAAFAQFTSAAQSRAALKEGEFRLRPELAGVHPRLLSSPAELQAAIATWQAEPEIFAPLADPRNLPEKSPVPIEKDLNGWTYPRRLVYAAAFHLITEDAAAAEILHRWIVESYAPAYVKNPSPVAIPALAFANKDLAVGGILFFTSLVYDLLAADKAYQEKYPGDLEILEKALLVQGAQTYGDLAALPAPWYEQNHFYMPAAGLAMAAIVLYDKVGAHPELASWAVWTRNALGRTKETLSSDGFYYESLTYWNGCFPFVSASLEALRRATGEDWLTPREGAAPALFSGLDRYLAHMALPEPGKAFGYADYGPREPWPGYRFFLSDLKLAIALLPMLQMAETCPSPLVAFSISREWNDRAAYERPKPDGLEAAYVLLKLPALKRHLASVPEINEVPAWHYFADHEVVCWRSAWDGPAAKNGTALFFKCGPPEGHRAARLLAKYPDWKMAIGHAHPDAGSFSIFAHGAYLATDPGYSGSKRTAEHNCLLIDGKGQYKEGSTWDVFAAAPYAKYDPLRLEDVWLASPVAAATAVATAAYDDALKLEDYRRQLILVGSRWMVVRDSVKAPDPHVYTWVLNSDRPFRPADGDRRWVTESGRGRLVVQSLSPITASRTEPTLVNVDLSGQRPEPVTRAHHLALDLPPAPAAVFTNVLCIQPKSDNPQAFAAAESGDGVIDIRDGKDVCRILLGPGKDLDGAYGYVWSSNGKLRSCGFEGTRLALPGGPVLSLGMAGKVALTRNKAGQWRVESDLPAAAVLKIVRGGGEPESLPLPAGTSVQLADLRL